MFLFTLNFLAHEKTTHLYYSVNRYNKHYTRGNPTCELNFKADRSYPHGRGNAGKHNLACECYGGAGQKRGRIVRQQQRSRTHCKPTHSGQTRKGNQFS
jgi:hypothetical protein